MHRRLIPHAEAATVMHRESREGLPSQRPTDSSGLGRSAACSQGLGRSAYFALVRHEHRKESCLDGLLARRERSAAGRKSSGARFPRANRARSRSRRPAAWLGTRIASGPPGFSLRAFATSRSRPGPATRSQSIHRASRHAPARGPGVAGTRCEDRGLVSVAVRSFS